MKKKYVVTGIMVVLSVLLAYSQFVQSSCNADDAGTYVYMYNFFELGNKSLGLKTYLNPWFYCSAIAYLLNIGGSGSFASLAYLSVWYGIAVFFTLVMVMHRKDAKWLLALAVFILLPYGSTNRYHMVAAFVTLFVIWALQCYTENGKKWILWVVGLVSVYALIFTDDRLLLVLFLLGTMVVYLAIWIFQDQSKRKYLYMLIFGVVLAAVAIKCIDTVSVKIFGQSTGITDALDGYGGAAYYSWVDVDVLVNKGIPSLFSSLLVQWNVPMKGGMIQVNSLYWFVRIVLACLAVVALACRWRQIVKKGIRNVELMDSLAVICTTVVLCANSFNGMIEYYSIRSTPTNRYASVCWFLLVVILARWLDERFSGMMIWRDVSYNSFCGAIFILLCVGYVSPVFRASEAVADRACAMEIDYLREQGETYRYGIGSQWRSTPVTAATNAEHVVCRGWIEDDRLVYSKSDGFYMDGGNYFNFIVSDVDSEMTVSPENIENIRGDYTGIYSNGDTIYMYDYDIRFDTTVVMDTAGMGYEFTEPIVYNLELPVGSSRIELTTPQRDNLLLDVLENEDIADVKIGSKGDNIATVEVTCLQNTQIGLYVGRKEDVPTQLYKVEIKRTAGAVRVDEQQTAIPLNAGRYIVTFSGENLKDMEVNWDIDGEVTQLTNGRIKRRYLIDVSQKQDVGYHIISNGADVNTIYYENEDLFDE